VRISRTCHLFAKYDAIRNEIVFGCQNSNEADAIGTLIHEDTHWAAWCYLTLREIQITNMPDCNKDYDKYACWIPEYISITVEHLAQETR
jgi:hypothetical protein